MLGKKKHKKYKSDVTNKFEEKAPKQLERAQPLNAPVLVIVIEDDALQALEGNGFDTEWLQSLANRYNFNKIEYMDKFKGFRCYQSGKVVDTITANDLASLNSNKRLTDNGMPFRAVPKQQQVIQIPWRK